MTLFALLSVLLTIGVTLGSASNEPTKTLNEIKAETLSEFKTTNYFPSLRHLAAVSQTCVDEKLNIAVNGEKRTTMLIGNSAVVSAFALCLSDSSAFYNAHFKDSMEHLKDIFFDFNQYVPCVKLELQKINPGSSLLNNFAPTASQIKTCNDVAGDIIPLCKTASSVLILSGCEDEQENDDEVNEEVYTKILLVTGERRNSAALTAAKSRHREEVKRNAEKGLKCTLKKIK